jgi:phosphatidylserine/phosphatidylglycerophosphate/cardiolipin synthase-like enzyme
MKPMTRTKRFLALLSLTLALAGCVGPSQGGDLINNAVATVNAASTQAVATMTAQVPATIPPAATAVPAEPTLAPTVEVPATTGGPVDQSNSLWAVYFTDPKIPFDNVTTGGVDDSIVWLIDHTQNTIDLAMFEFNLEDMAQALIAAHNRGVQVRVVYDNEHTADDPQTQELIDAGIPATPDERSAFMHDKFIVFDHNIVWTGSLNFTVGGVYRNNNNAIAIISPELADNYTNEFEKMFNGTFGPKKVSDTPHPGVQVGDMWVENYFAPEDDVMTQVISVVSEAQQSIHFMSFSFTEDPLGQAMMDRAAAGADLRGIFESTGANTQYSECPPLLNAGYDVRLDNNPATFHHKVIIIDGQIVVTGSFNFSQNATTSNDENLLIIHNPAIAALYENEFNKWYAQANMPTGGECLAAGH